MTVLGVDVGGTSLRVASTVDNVRIVPVPTTYQGILETIAELAGTPQAVAVGLPGATGLAVPRWIPALPFLDGQPLAEELSARLGGAHVILANDAQLALLGEARLGAAKGLGDVVLISVGTGIGGAIMRNGKLVRGAHGTAGSFGWLTANGVNATADHGAFELTASGRAMDALASPGSGHDLVRAARNGDESARTALDGWATDLGTGIAAIASILDPERVVLSGGLSESFEAYADALRAAVRRAGSPDGRAVPVVPAALGSHAGVIGALCAASVGEAIFT